MLREARARMVDVETGERPGEMRPLAEDPPDDAPPPSRDAAARRPRRREPAGPPRTIVPETSPAEGERGAGDDTNAAPFGTDGLLWLEDSPSEEDASPDRDDGEPRSRPWRRGLRG